MKNKAMQDAERNLSVLIQEIRHQPEMERVKLYVAKMSAGCELSAYLGDNSVPVKERALLVTTLNEILLTKDYNRLPLIHTEDTNSYTTAKPERDSPHASDMRRIVREELASVFELVAKVLREKP